MELLYEKDLRGMKYNVLTSIRHDRVVREIASICGISPQVIRRALIAKLDMIQLENLPARYEASRNAAGGADPLVHAVCGDLLTQAVPLLATTDIDQVRGMVRDAISSGTPEPDAAIAARPYLARLIQERGN
ncbi:MAG: DUF1959 domain-containing protein [Methanomicrobiales archaeon]|nr:DUF1959 domain-containing protein [Methanomicrobiales archaeon]